MRENDTSKKHATLKHRFSGKQEMAVFWNYTSAV